MDVYSIVEKYLRENGYDGLFSADCCACLVDDLCPCDDMKGSCEAGHKAPCDCGDGHQFHIVGGKPKQKGGA